MSDHAKIKNLILGAGITGLSAGIKTGFPIYEAGGVPGGICRSYYKDGFRFEKGGGHWIFGAGSAIEFIEKHARLLKYDRVAAVYLNQTIPYPLQTYFSEEEGYYPSSLKGWLFDRFGNDLCRLFFWPFNKKYTAGLYDEIVQADPSKSPDPQTAGYNAQFAYPMKGLDHLVDAMATGQEIHYNKKAVEINPTQKIVTFQDGETVEYDKLISTIPLKELLKMMKKYQGDLPHTSVLVLNIGAEAGPRMPKDHWLYISDPSVPFFRVGFYSNVDQNFSPPGHVSVYVERAFQEGAELPAEYEYRYYVAGTLQDWGWIGAVKVIDPNFINYGYTWTKEDSSVKEQLRYLETCFDIKSIGRYGKWRFQGIAESIEDGLSI